MWPVKIGDILLGRGSERRKIQTVSASAIPETSSSSSHESLAQSPSIEQRMCLHVFIGSLLNILASPIHGLENNSPGFL